ncbi:hypothetical protein R1flu_025346 [Riccia fluitans]|uniref:1-acylglycerol-3-phosphate O-acyltransferase n=1 Tax=Riccia fluitans TaxID=41844 RepID=A0ABD1XXH5_9MARC
MMKMILKTSRLREEKIGDQPSSCDHKQREIELPPGGSGQVTPVELGVRHNLTHISMPLMHFLQAEFLDLKVFLQAIMIVASEEEDGKRKNGSAEVGAQDAYTPESSETKFAAFVQQKWPVDSNGALKTPWARLVSVDKNFSNIELVNEDEVFVGRADVVSATGTEDLHISEAHCKIWRSGENDACYIQNLSVNGTTVQGKLIEKDEQEILHQGDEVALGPHTSGCPVFIFQLINRVLIAHQKRGLEIETDSAAPQAVEHIDETASGAMRPKEGTISHKPLTLYRIIRGVMCLIILLSTAFVTLITLGPFMFIVLRLYSVHTSRKCIGFIFGQWLSMWPYFFEKINGTNVIFSGDNVPAGERAMVMCNHRTEVDWMYTWNLALRKNQIGFTKYALKSSVRNVPLFGWAFHVLEFLPLDRKWELDAPVIESYLRSFADPEDPFWFVLFPEGTDFTEEKLAKGNVYARQLGLRGDLHHVLLPRTKGFMACLPLLTNSVIAVYDLTIAYKYRCPLFIDNLFGIDPAEVHIHIRRIPIKDIPTSEEEASSWLYDAFYKKDSLMTGFYKDGSFPNVIDQGELNTLGFLIRSTVFTIASMLVLKFALFGDGWVRLYVTVSCMILPTITFFGLKPSPLVNSR